ncbi:hypothetical protein [Paenibacillus glacialis]|uniref:Nucleotide-diphospho-sugar transferase domain-containing protein n=1 Tax=Paenibacillus glacialis TaxID=494026 RepID=A0A168PFF0_9BACL|nr:hypothetical protein [Paenibacillus glacialis]OAB46708.1 hypothetical protein PGLA_00330 [Paenibacillus glacialis]
MICFLILAHYAEDVLQDQVNNIRRLVPGSKVIVYNGGLDPDFGKNCSVDVCPKSSFVQKPKLARVLYDTMCWLEEMDENYDYLVYIDSDMLFINDGFEAYIEKLMLNHDCIALYLRKIDELDPNAWWGPARTMWQEWERWKSFFGTDYFMGCLNAMQLFRKSIVQKMLSSFNSDELEELLFHTDVYALEEIVHVTLAARCGARYRSYPKECEEYMILDRSLTVEDIQVAITKKDVYFVHPISRVITDEARVWINQNV